MKIYENIQKYYKLERFETWWKFIGTILNQTIFEDRLVTIPQVVRIFYASLLQF